MSSLTAEAENAARRVLRVGDWHVDAMRNEVRRGAEAVRLEPKVIEVLVYLARRAGEVVGREELLSAVWPGVVVGDDTLTQAIIKLRKAFGDDAHRPKYIETISKRGYRLIAPVEAGAATSAASTAGAATSRRFVGPALATVTILLAAAIAVPLLSGSIRMPWPLGTDTRGAPTASMPIVAILPLANLSGDPQREYFTDGVTEDIITGLGRFSGLRVMSANAVQEFKGRTATLQALQTQLGARYIVKGSVREADRHLRVAVELSDADKGVLLWSERYDGEGAQLFEIQERIVANIVSALQVRLTRLEQERVFTRPTASLEAHDLVLRARWLLNKLDRKANREARALLARARDLTPDYGEVFTALGEAEMQRALYGWVEDPPEAMKRAEDLARRTLASADTRTHARAHALISSIYGNLGRYEESLRHADLALAVNPSDASALYRRAAALLFQGKVDEALAGFEIARRSEPQLERNGGNFAYAYYTAGRYGECLAVVETMLTTYPNDVTLRAIRTATLSQLGREDDARKAAEDVRRLSPGFEVGNFGARFADPAHRAKLHEGLIKAGMQ